MERFSIPKCMKLNYKLIIRYQTYFIYIDIKFCFEYKKEHSKKMVVSISLLIKLLHILISVAGNKVIIFELFLLSMNILAMPST